MNEEQEMRLLIDTIIGYASPRKIILFGSRAHGLSRPESDFDLCVIYDKLPKRNLEVLQDLYRSIFSLTVHAVDLVVFQADRFEKRASQRGSFESSIKNEGKAVYG